MDNISYTTQSSTGSYPVPPPSTFQANSRFDSIKYVNELTSKPSINLDALLHARKTVANYGDETNTQLKRNVYANYQLFIDTSKEISYLKKEMSQLSKILNDENKLLDALLAISIGGSKVGLTPGEKKEALEKVKEERERKMLQASKSNLNGPLPTKEFRTLMEHIEGGAGIIDNKADSLVYFEGEVTELDDTQDYRELQVMYLVLLNDSLIMSTLQHSTGGGGAGLPKITFSIAGGPPSSGPSGRAKYKFNSIIDLETIAVVNVKDRRFPKYESAFKVLMSATTKVFLTGSTLKKKAWVEAFEIAKKYRRTASRLQRRDTMLLPSSSSMSISPGVGGGVSASAHHHHSTDPFAVSSESQATGGYTANPFEETEDDDEDDETDPEAPNWLLELPDDLDVYIAQRNFEEAVKLVGNAQNHFYMYPKSQVDLKLRIDNKISELVDALSAELNVAPDRSLQTGPRASRRAVSLLVRLGKSSIAIRLFLDQRTKLLKHFKKSLSSEGQTLTYMKRMTSLYFSHIVETSKEFLRAFEIDDSHLGVGPLKNGMEMTGDSSLETGTKWSRRNSEDGTVDETSSGGQSASTPTLAFSHSVLACLNKWNYEQLKAYLELFPKDVLLPTTKKEDKVECIAIAHHHCLKLRHSIGVDFTFVLSRELQKPIEGLIRELQNHMVDSIKKLAEDGFTRESITEQIFDSKAKLGKFSQEMSALEFEIEEWLQEATDGRSDPPRVVYALQLTANTTAFAKLYLGTLRDLVKLATHPTLVKRLNEVLVHGFKLQMAHLAKCAKPRVNGQSGNPELVRLNIAFMLDRLIPVVVRKYCEALSLRSFNDLQVLSIDYAYLKEAGAAGGGGGRVTTSFSTSSSPKVGSPFGSPVPAPRARRTTTSIAVNQSNGTASPGSPGGGGAGANGSWTSGTYL